MADAESRPFQLFRARSQEDGTHSGTRYSRALAQGRLLRVRRGIYCLPHQWVLAKPSERHLLATAATSLLNGSATFCRETSLNLRGLPLLNLPQQVHLRASSPGAVRAAAQPSMTGRLSAASFWARTELAEQDEVRLSSYTFRGFSTKRLSPWPEDLGATARSAPTPVPLPLAPPDEGMQVQAEPLRLALPDTVPRMPFADAVVVLESVLHGDREAHRPPIPLSTLHEWAEQVIPSKRRMRMWELVSEFACASVESPGESLSRVRFRELGFQQPRVQVSLNVAGVVYRVDFLWEGAGVIGEFDGWKKYRQGGFHQVHQQEKIREDALRSIGLTPVRWYWDDLLEPGCTRLVRLLEHRGIPRTLRSP